MRRSTSRGIFWIAMQPGQLVKLRQPENEAEAAARFSLVEVNGDRALIRLLCDLPIPPVELVRISDIAPAGDAEAQSD